MAKRRPKVDFGPPTPIDTPTHLAHGEGVGGGVNLSPWGYRIEDIGEERLSWKMGKVESPVAQGLVGCSLQCGARHVILAAVWCEDCHSRCSLVLSMLFLVQFGARNFILAAVLCGECDSRCSLVLRM